MSDAVSRRAAGRIAAEIANRVGSSVQLSGVTFDWAFAPCLQHLTLERRFGNARVRFSTPEACIHRWASALGSGFRAVRIQLERPSVEFVGDDAEAPVLKVSPSRGWTRPHPRNGRPPLRELELLFDDLRLDWNTLPLPQRLARGTFGPIDGQVTLQLRGPRSAALFEVRAPSGSSLTGRYDAGRTGWNLSAGIAGDLVAIFGSLLDSSELDIRRVPMTGRLGVSYAAATSHLVADVDLREDDVDVASHVVSRRRLSGFSARQRARLEIDVGARRLVMNEALVEVNRVPVVLSLRIFPRGASLGFSLHAELRTSPLVRLLGAVPDNRAMPIVKRISPSISIAASLSMEGDLQEPGTWKPEVDYRFRTVDATRIYTGLEFLETSFRYHPLTPHGRRDEPIVTGPTTEHWVAYRSIPYLVRRVVTVAEDASFPFHRGIDMAEIRDALGQSLDTNRRMRGGSTLTQQLVKNLFLSRERTALRKLREVLLTFHLESTLTKEEIFELYVNLIEWGPDIYGIGAASRYYFDRAVHALSPLEAAYLATIIPNPVRMHRHYASGSVPPPHRSRVIALLERLNRLGQLSDETLEEARVERIRFARRHRTGR